MGEKNKKREKFIEEKKKGFEFKKVYLIPVLIAIAAFLFVAFSGVNENPENLIGDSNTGKKYPNSTLIPISEVDDGKAHFYSYKSSGGKIIRFFVLKSSDGVFRAAFDACDVCYLAKKGYRQEGDYMVCNNCGNRFPSTKINEESGGCNPAPLNRVIDGENIVIKNEDIEKGEKYF